MGIYYIWGIYIVYYTAHSWSEFMYISNARSYMCTNSIAGIMEKPAFLRNAYHGPIFLRIFRIRDLAITFASLHCGVWLDDDFLLHRLAGKCDVSEESKHYHQRAKQLEATPIIILWIGFWAHLLIFR